RGRSWLPAPHSVPSETLADVLHALLVRLPVQLLPRDAVAFGEARGPIAARTERDDVRTVAALAVTAIAKPAADRMILRELAVLHREFPRPHDVAVAYLLPIREYLDLHRLAHSALLSSGERPNRLPYKGA